MGDRNWPSQLAVLASHIREDGGRGLGMLAAQVGLGDPPSMKIVISREKYVPPAPRRR